MAIFEEKTNIENETVENEEIFNLLEGSYNLILSIINVIFLVFYSFIKN